MQRNNQIACKNGLRGNFDGIQNVLWHLISITQLRARDRAIISTIIMYMHRIEHVFNDNTENKINPVTGVECTLLYSNN